MLTRVLGFWKCIVRLILIFWYMMNKKSKSLQNGHYLISKIEKHVNHLFFWLIQVVHKKKYLLHFFNHYISFLANLIKMLILAWFKFFTEVVPMVDCGNWSLTVIRLACIIRCGRATSTNQITEGTKKKKRVFSRPLQNADNHVGGFSIITISQGKSVVVTTNIGRVVIATNISSTSS